MKPVPEHIQAMGPPGTVWSGGPMDRTSVTLRVKPKARGELVDIAGVAKLLGCATDREHYQSWCLHAPDSAEGDLDSQIAWILQRVTDDRSIWRGLSQDYRVDIFCGLFMERSNRGVLLSAATMYELGVRNIEIGLDIYAPQE